MNLLPTFSTSIKGCSLKPKGWCIIRHPERKIQVICWTCIFSFGEKKTPPLPSSTRLIYRRGPRRFMKLPKCRSQEFRFVSFRRFFSEWQVVVVFVMVFFTPQDGWLVVVNFVREMWDPWIFQSKFYPPEIYAWMPTKCLWYLPVEPHEAVAEVSRIGNI